MRSHSLFLLLVAFPVVACERGGNAADSAATTAVSLAESAPPPPPSPAPGVARDERSLGFGTVGDVGRRQTLLAEQQLKVAETGAVAGSFAARAANAMQFPSRPGIADRSSPEMVIRTGQASVQVDSLDLAVARVRQLAARVGGSIANSSLQSGRDQVRSATLEIRVAAPRFDELVAGLTPFGKVEAVNVSAEDVGEEFVDLSARVTNARRLEARLIELLATRTGKLSDVLTVERELARVREEIERYEGRLRYLQARSAVSTLAVTVHEPMPLLAGAPATNPIAQAFIQAWRNFVALLAAVIASLGVLVPVAAIGALVWVGTRKLRKAVPAERPVAG